MSTPFESAQLNLQLYALRREPALTANAGDTDALPSGPGSFARARKGAVY